MQNNQVFLFATHYYSPAILRQFREIEESTSGIGDCFLLYHQKGINPPDRRFLKGPHFIVTDSDLVSLGYAPCSNEGIVPGSGHFPLLYFYRERKYDYYWYIEYDVEFTGKWSTFFGYFNDNDADFISCHIKRHSDTPNWYWWKSLSHPVEKIPPSEMIRSFNPIFRISFDSLKHIDEMHSNGWKGHNEVLIPTLLHRKGFKIKDLDNNGNFVGSMRPYWSFICLLFKPKNKLFHPKKPFMMAVVTSTQRIFTIMRRIGSRLRNKPLL